MTSGAPMIREAIERTALEATLGALWTAMSGPPIQNRDRISAPDAVDRMWWTNHPMSSGASPDPSRAQMATVSRLSAT
ncbi:MAG: hypothetical protein QOC58_2136 [Mycobacterium sp.]|nr:hypothetical protein [Mycobacterium sp.]